MKLLYIDAKPTVRVDDNDPAWLWQEFENKYDYSTWNFQASQIAHSEKLMEQDGLVGNTVIEKFIDWLNKRGIGAVSVW